jgi:hypothetical protein
VETKVVTSGPPLPTSEEVEEEGGASAPPSENTGTAKLSAAEMGRLRGVLEQVAASRKAVDARNLKERNTDLQQEWCRLDRGGWDARKIDLALSHPRNIKSDTGWVLAEFRDLQTDPDEDPRVIEAQMFLMAYLHQFIQSEPERLAPYGISVDEYNHLFDQAKAHGYLLDDGWTEDGLRMSRQVEDFEGADDDPKWGLIHQALERWEPMQT